MVLKQCNIENCFANIKGRCDILKSTVFSSSCPFYKHEKDVNKEEIERICSNYEMYHSGGKLAKMVR